jgi:uncharacterized protein (TIGR02598 family)
MLLHTTMSLIRRKNRWKPGETAFSLVEVAIAFAVLSFAMITLLGLLPLALTTFRETKRDTIHANILQYLAATANLTPFASLATPSAFATNWNFDDQGQVLSTNATTAGTIYSAYITVTSNANAITNPSGEALLPGASAVSANTYLLTVRIVDTDQPTLPTTNAIIVPNMGK